MKHWKIISRSLVILTLTSAVTACGFHLRGNIPLSESIDNMYVNGNGGPFQKQLEEILVKAGVTIAPYFEGAEVQLKILESQVDRTVGTLDERGKANSYRLTYIASYVLETPDGRVLREATISDQRLYDFDPDAILESESDEGELIVDMEESVSLQVLRQLSTITGFQPAAIQPAAK